MHLAGMNRARIFLVLEPGSLGILEEAINVNGFDLRLNRFIFSLASSKK